MSTERLDQAADWIADAGRVVARKSTIDAWIHEPDLRREAWQFRLAHRDTSFDPNDAHRALADLQRMGRLDLVVTQNIDGLHQDAGVDADRVVEVHGTAREVVCLECGVRSPMQGVLARVAEGELDPHCRDCDGLLESATIAFGQALVDADIDRAKAASESSDVFLALG